MAAADPIGAIRAGLAANLAVLNGVQVSAYMLNSPTPPVVQIFPAYITYDQAMNRGADELTFTVQAQVGAVSDQAAQMLLDLMLAPSGAQSIKAALEADRTLGGAAQALRVTESTGYQQLVSGVGSPSLLAEWTVQIIR